MKRLLTGIVVGIGIIVFTMFLLTLVPLRMHTVDPESSAFQSIHTLALAMEKQNAATGRYPTSFVELSPLLAEDLKTCVKAGYRFTVSGDGKSYAITAAPLHYGGKTKRSIYFDPAGHIRVSSGPEPANSGSPELTFDSNQ
jgi:hypothetical protein